MAFSLPRTLNLAACCGCILLLVAAIAMEYFWGLQPCPLCILQRIILVALGLLLMIAVLHNPRNWALRFYGFFICMLALSGLWAAARQVWLEHQPASQKAICLPGLSYMVSYLPLKQVIQILFEGEESCGEVKWRLLGLSIANWTLFCFIALFLFGLWQIFYAERPVKPRLK